jgi:anti-sigma B factor antagonist
VVVADLNGKLTAGLGDRILRDTIDTLLADGWRKILVNLSEVSFMDSAGVGELVAGLRTARNLGGSLKLLNANERVHSTLYIARLLPIFEIYREEKDALAHF